MDVANRLLPAAAPGVEPARPVRSTGAHPDVRHRRRAPSSWRGRRRGARRASAQGGTVAVIAPLELHGAIAAALADRGAVADDVEAHRRADRGARRGSTPRASSSTTWSWSSRRASSPPTARGLRLLYVILTRATRRLAVVHAEPLPEALELAPRSLGA